MSPVFASLIPVFLTLALGVGLRRWSTMGPADWVGLERATYHVFTPALIIYTLATADIPGGEVLRLGGALFLAVLAMSSLCLVLRRPLAAGLQLSGPAFTSLFQGATRWNTYIGLALAAALFGRDGVALAAIAIVGMIPLLNLVNVAVLATYASAERPAPRAFGLMLIKNPFIWSCLVGIVLNVSGLRLPSSVAAAANMLGQASIGPAILLVGAGLDLGAIGAQRGVLALSIALKLVAMPLLAAGFGWMLGLDGMARSVALVCAAVPTASASYILARQMGGDAPLMARIITAETLLAFVTVPIILALV